MYLLLFNESALNNKRILRKFKSNLYPKKPLLFHKLKRL